ncbi:Protein of unknown function (DUF3435) domain containing protein [Elaphomyces granulatus]
MLIWTIVSRTRISCRAQDLQAHEEEKHIRRGCLSRHLPPSLGAFEVFPSRENDNSTSHNQSMVLHHRDSARRVASAETHSSFWVVPWQTQAGPDFPEREQTPYDYEVHKSLLKDLGQDAGFEDHLGHYNYQRWTANEANRIFTSQERKRVLGQSGDGVFERHYQSEFIQRDLQHAVFLRPSQEGLLRRAGGMLWNRDPLAPSDLTDEQRQLRREKMELKEELRSLAGTIQNAQGPFPQLYQRHEAVKKELSKLRKTVRNDTRETARKEYFHIRNQYGSFVPAAHILIQKEDSDIVAAALREIRGYCRDRWTPKWVLTDDSAEEQAAVRKAFKDAPIPLPEHLLCMVHSDRTLRRKMAGKANATARAHMQTALWTRKTEAGCKDSISKAIETAKDEATRVYIKKNLEVDIEMWTYFAHRKACLLQQFNLNLCFATTTNAVEGWHSQLKNNPGALKNEIPNVASEYDKNARLKQCEIDSKDVLEAVQFHPTLQKFPYLAQYLISEELHLLYKADMELER